MRTERSENGCTAAPPSETGSSDSRMTTKKQKTSVGNARSTWAADGVTAVHHTSSARQIRIASARVPRGFRTPR